MSLTGSSPANAAPAASAIWTKHVAAVVSVGIAFALREFAQPWIATKVPFLQFYPAILFSAWFGGFGPAILATTLSSALALYFYLPPIGFGVADPMDAASLVIFAATGVAIAAFKRQAQSAQASTVEALQLAAARAERLDAIINTTVDGIIVIDAEGRIESFNRGAERLFGYQAGDVIGQNVSMLMPSPHHENHRCSPRTS